jgi:hypothetical protein
MSLFQWTFVTTAMVMSLLFFPSHLGAAKDAQLLLSGDLHKVNEPFTVIVVNPGPKDMWFCVQVAKTVLHPDSQDRPIPVFTVRYRKSKGTKWGDLLWGRDYGGLEVPELLGAGEKRSYQIGLPQPGMYQLELIYRSREISTNDCQTGISGASRVRSREFAVEK